MHMFQTLAVPKPTWRELRCTWLVYSECHCQLQMKSDAHETMVLESPTPWMTCESDIWCVQCCPLLTFHCSWRPRLSQEPHQRSEVLLLCSMRAWVWRCGVRVGVGWGGGLGWSWRLVRVCVCVGCLAGRICCLLACMLASFCVVPLTSPTREGPKIITQSHVEIHI